MTINTHIYTVNVLICGNDERQYFAQTIKHRLLCMYIWSVMSHYFNYLTICIVITSHVVISRQDDLLTGNDYDRKLKNICLFNKMISNYQQSRWFLPEQFPTLQNFNMDFNNMSSAIKNPDSERLESTLLKAFRGEPVEIVVYGGSNTAAGLFPIILQQWWDKNITPISGSVLKVNNKAIGGTSSTYFQFCHGIYLDADEVVDLFILDVSANDAVSNLQNASIRRSLPLEQFTRQLLNLHNVPGVLFVNLYNLIGKPLQCINLMNFGQDRIITHYNVAAIELRDLVCSFHESEKSYYATSKTYDLLDPGGTMHINSKGHAQIAFMIVQLLMRTLNKLIDNVDIFANSVKPHILPLPPFVYIRNLNSAMTSPLCWASLTPDYKYNALRSTLRLKVVKLKGFVYVKSNIKIGERSYSSKEERTDAFGGLVANEKGSKTTISFTVYFLCSVGVITRSSGNGGEVDVWLDNDYMKRINIKLHQHRDQTVVRIIATQVVAGTHTLTMDVVKQGISALVGVVIGPSDGPW